MAIAFLAAMPLSSCGEEKESTDQGPVPATPDTSVETNQESETNSEPTPSEDDTSSSSASENNGETDTGSSGESQQSPNKQEETP